MPLYLFKAIFKLFSYLSLYHIFWEVSPQCASLLAIGSRILLLLQRLLQLEVVKHCPDVLVRVVGDLPADCDGGVV